MQGTDIWQGTDIRQSLLSQKQQLPGIRMSDEVFHELSLVSQALRVHAFTLGILEAEAGGSLLVWDQSDLHIKFQTSQYYIVRP